MPILPLPDSEFSYDPDPVHSLASPFQEDTKLLRGIDSLVNQLGADFARHARESRLSDFKKPWLACIDVYHSPQGALFVEGVKRKWTELAGTGGGRVAIPAPERTLILDTSVALLDHSRLESIAKDYMTDDPVFGHVCNDLLIHSLLDSEIWEEKVVKPVERHCAGYIDGPSEVDAIIVIGVGAFAELGVREWADCAWVFHKAVSAFTVSCFLFRLNPFLSLAVSWLWCLESIFITLSRYHRTFTRPSGTHSHKRTY